MDGYIIERVISSQKQSIQFSAVIEVYGIKPDVPSPLFLKNAEVVSISPICSGIQGSALHCNSIPVDRVLLKLSCVVVDVHGCVLQGWAQIEVDVRTPSCTGIVGRSAEFRIRNARYCGNCTFHIGADICIFTIVSRREVITQRCKRIYELPPLYPSAKQNHQL